MRAMRRAAWILALAVVPWTVAPVWAAQDPQDASEGDRVEVLSAFDSSLSALVCSARTEADATQRLVVRRDGACVLDRGLREVHDTDTTDAGELAQSGIVDRATVSPDRRVAVIETIAYASRPANAKPAAEGDVDGLLATSELTWVDPYHPGGKWVVRLEPSRWVKQVVPLSRRRGVAVATYREVQGESDFRLLGADGRETIRIPESEAWTLDIAASPDGEFVAVDQAFDGKPGRPDRAILVLDVLHSTRWSYTWKYGSDEEPKSWSIEDKGVLVVEKPGGDSRRVRAPRSR